MSSITYKQIYFDENSGLLKIIDNQNNNYECNIYGDKKPQFLPDITGFANVDQRKKLGQPFDTNFKLDNSLYRTQTSHFEGYFQFPQPLSLPFFNEHFDRNNNKKLLKSLFQESKGQINLPKNKHLMELKSNEGIHYLTSNFSISDETSKHKLIECIDNFIEEFRNENKYKLEIFNKDPKIKALIRLKKLMLINNKEKLVHGRKVPSPDDKFLSRFLINNKLIKKKVNLYNKYHTINKEREEFSREKSNPKMSHTQSINKTLNLNKAQNLNKTNVSELSLNFIEKNLNSQINFFENTDKENLSFLSGESNEDKNIQNYKHLKLRKDLERKNSKEKKYLVGYIPIIEKEKGIVEKSIPKGIKNNGDLYFENMRLLRKVNPIAFEREERNNKLLDQEMRKKRQMKVIFEKNQGF